MHSINGTKTKRENSDMWRTPRPLFDYLNSIYHFNLDAYANKEDTLCENYIGKDDDANIVSWGDYVDNAPVVAFCNPPYSQPNILLCLQAARGEARKGATVVVLIPNQPTKYWDDLIIGQADRILITLGRISFIDPVTLEPRSGNAGGSAIITYLPRSRRTRHVSTETSYRLVEDIIFYAP